MFHGFDRAFLGGDELPAGDAGNLEGADGAAIATAARVFWILTEMCPRAKIEWRRACARGFSTA
jgi:hypothetical protein